MEKPALVLVKFLILFPLAMQQLSNVFLNFSTCTKSEKQKQKGTIEPKKCLLFQKQ